MGKRKDHHKRIIRMIVEMYPPLKITQFHTAQKMPRVLRGVPDLHILFGGLSFWVEIKPRYANYMRDQMSDLQWTWLHERYIQFGDKNRYMIVEDEQEFADVFNDWANNPFVYMSDYHQGRYETWRRGR